MRIDKFLKISRLIKRRTVAKEACQTGRVKINGKVAKSGSSVQVGDILEILYASGMRKFRVLEIPERSHGFSDSFIEEIRNWD